MPAALIMLVLVFGAVVAAVVPLVLGAGRDRRRTRAGGVVGQAFDLSVFLVQMPP